MNCESARELLLTADPAELEGRTGSPLADHLRSCPACRAAAERLLTAQRALRDVLGAGQAAGAATAAVRVAVQSAERRRRAARRVLLGLPLAAAAVLAGVLVLRRTPEPPLSPPVRDAGGVPARFAVSAPPGRNVMVLQQPDTSHVIVVWFF
jgi:predicted anti-sigma-YlaC factor YlaD